jgi:hypothetical protein
LETAYDEETENESTTMASNSASREEMMPLLFYTRVQGTTLRSPPPTTAVLATPTSPPFSMDCTCSTMGQVRWSPDMLAVEGTGSSAAADIFYRTGRPDAPSSTTAAAAPSTEFMDPSSSMTTQDDEAAAAAAAAAKLCMEEPMPIQALGFANGTVQLLYRQNSTPLSLSKNPLQVREGPPPRGTTSHAPIVDVCLDATGTILAAIDQAGLVTIWEYKLEFVRSTTTISTSA